MSLGILNNIAALYAENNLNSTQSSLQNTLQQLSSGSRINSGADDAAGLAVANGLGANEAALTQSAQNATAGIGLLQTADGALSQVTNLLDRAVTLATESANGTLTGGQVSSANQEYQNILAQIGNIGATTNFNSSDVFNPDATNIVVTDGTSSGLNTYADIVGGLSTSSVGTSAGTAVDANKLNGANMVATPASAGSTRVAGQYVLNTINSTDTVGGQFSFTVGSTNAQEIDVNVAAGTTLAGLRDQLNNGTPAFSNAGLHASLNSAGDLLIAGPTSGANPAANTVTFTNTNLTDTLTEPAVTGGPTVVGTASKGSLTIAGASSGDAFGGTIILTQGTGSGSITTTITVPDTDTVGTSGTVESYITSQLVGTGFTLAADTGADPNNPTLNFTGANNTTPITITGNFSNQTHPSPVGTVTDNAGVAGTLASYTLSALNNSLDTFGANSAITIGTGTTPVSIAGMNGTQAANAITTAEGPSGANTGITAAFTNGKLIISGNPNGAALPAGISLDTVTDVSHTMEPNLTTLGLAAGTIGPTGSQAVPNANIVITPLNVGDTLGGILQVTVGSAGPSQQVAKLAVNNGTTGQGLADAINADASFIAAGVTASWNTETNPNALTINGPAGVGGGAAPAIALGALNSITDSTVSTPGAGANFAADSVSQLTANSAATVLTTVTAAVADVAYQRGTIGADINQLTSASNVASSESVNLTSAQQSITATDYGQAASNLSKYQILSQTGISALAQANSVQQEVLKLLQ